MRARRFAVALVMCVACFCVLSYPVEASICWQHYCDLRWEFEAGNEVYATATTHTCGTPRAYISVEADLAWNYTIVWHRKNGVNNGEILDPSVPKIWLLTIHHYADGPTTVPGRWDLCSYGNVVDDSLGYPVQYSASDSDGPLYYTPPGYCSSPIRVSSARTLWEEAYSLRLTSMPRQWDVYSYFDLFRGSTTLSDEAGLQLIRAIKAYLPQYNEVGNWVPAIVLCPGNHRVAVLVARGDTVIGELWLTWGGGAWQPAPGH